MNPLNAIKNFVVYYSIISPEDVPRISSYDLAVIHPFGATDDIISQLKASGTLLYAYVSAVEIEKYDDLKNSLMLEDAYLYDNGEKFFKSEFDCYGGDILSKSYQDILQNIIKDRIIDKGYSGVFFDTLDDIETLRDSHAVKDQIEGYIAFFKELKSKYPDLSIIQNRGFSLFEQGSSVYTDALLFEDLNFQKADTNEYYKNLVHRLSSIAAKSNCRIMAISHNDRQENHIFCKKLNWLYYHCPYDNNYMTFETEIDNVSNRPWFSF